MQRQIRTIVGIMLLIVGLATPVSSQAELGRIRIIHAATSVALVDVFAGSERVLTQIPYASVSDYLDIPAGIHKIAVVAAGQDIADAAITAEVAVEAGKAYSLAAIGLPDTPSALYSDDLSAPAAGKARVRIIHTSPDAPGADVQVVNGPTLVQNLAFLEASPYLSVDADTYNIQVATVGENTAFIQLPNTIFTAGTIYDVVAVGRIATIEVAVATFTPASPENVGSQGSDADTTPQNVATMSMPATGLNDNLQIWLVLVGLCTIVSGLFVRQRMARYERQR